MQKNTPKLLFFSVIFLCLIQASFISCSQDEDLIDLVGLEDPDEETVDGSDGDSDGNSDGSDDQDTPDLGETDNGPDFDSSEGLKIDNTPCDYTLDGIESNSTLEIACRMDLGGQTITVPSGVTFVFAGGEIINGTLNFSAQGTIDGDLLNKDLTIEGDVKLDDPIFQFYPERWDIVQGDVDLQRAKDNSFGIQDAVDLVHSLEGDTFEIDKLDAFFHGKGGFNYNIVMPSNFHLKMTSNTHLRTFPSLDEYSTFLIMIQGVENVKVSGGYLHGDRDLYGRKDNLPRSHTMKIKTGVNVVIENVHMSNATQDGLAIESNRFTYDPDYIGSNNILIKNCVFDSNSRINLTITDGRDITVQGCTFIDGGVDTQYSNSMAPSCNLNIEPHRSRDSSGNLTEYQRVSNVTIRNNVQYLRDKENTKAGGFLLSHGYGPIIVENNEMTYCGVSFHTVDGVVIRNNEITGAGINAGSAETYDREDFVFGNEIYGNRVIYPEGTALNIAGNGVVARDNELEGTVGVAFGAGSTDSSMGASNCTLSNNIIRASSRGIRTTNTVKNVAIEGNNVHMLPGANFSMSLGNDWSSSSSANFVVSNNIISGNKSNSSTGAPPSLIGANSIDYKNNDSGDIQINGGRNINISDNNIDANIGEHGILFYDDAPNSNIENNSITVYTSQTPLNVQCITQANGVSLSSSVNISNNNSCTEQ